MKSLKSLFPLVILITLSAGHTYAQSLRGGKRALKAGYYYNDLGKGLSATYTFRANQRFQYDVGLGYHLNSDFLVYEPSIGDYMLYHGHFNAEAPLEHWNIQGSARYMLATFSHWAVFAEANAIYSRISDYHMVFPDGTQSNSLQLYGLIGTRLHLTSFIFIDASGGPGAYYKAYQQPVGAKFERIAFGGFPHLQGSVSLGFQF